MTYRAYIKKDYKPEIRWEGERSAYARFAVPLCITTLTVLSLTAFIFFNNEPVNAKVQALSLTRPAHETVQIALPATETPTARPVAADISQPATVALAPQPQSWKSITVKKGDSLSMIFDRLGLSPRLLYQIMHSGKEANILKDLMPGQSLDFRIEDGKFLALRFEPSLTRTLEVAKKGSDITSELILTELDYRTKQAHGNIDSSLFLAGQRAGLSDKLIMEMVSLFGWDIDFALDIRKGDEFKLIYQEQYKDGLKVGDGPIIAAEFTNRNEAYRALRYTSPDGDTNYYNEHGASMRKAFLRTPLKFSRISSRFNLRRKHPVLNRIRAHKGVDYAAPTGTPIKATGDGTVTLAGRKGGYGRTVILKHGGTRSTLYAHMSSISKNIRRRKRVKQGQVIGYVGKSGLATGPHLHYEFRVNGVHRNPLTVKFPKASSVPKKFLADFKQQTAIHLAELDTQRGQNLADNGADTDKFIALDDSLSAANSVH